LAKSSGVKRRSAFRAVWSIVISNHPQVVLNNFSDHEWMI